MMTIYLDQMKWIDLARAETGHPQGAQHVDSLEAFKRAADDGRASFPLSVAHYIETGKTQERRRRVDLAKTMMRLAGMDRIAPPHVIVPWEIRRAIIEVFDLNVRLPELQLFGETAAHAHALPSLRYPIPDEVDGTNLSEEQKRQLYEVAVPKWEEMILGGLAPAGYPESTRLVFQDMLNYDSQFVTEQNRIAGWVHKLGKAKLPNIMAATAMQDILEPAIEAAQELGVPPEDLVDARNVTRLIAHMPSRQVDMKLRHLRQANPQKRWEGNDLNDVTALAVAVPYCDVVVTEKFWSGLLNTAKVPGLYDTLVTPSLRDVVDLLEPPG